MSVALIFAETQCPANANLIRYRALEHSPIGVEVTIDGHGPYQFLLDTGAQLTVIEPSLMEELDLQPAGSIGVLAVANYSQARLVVPDTIQAGSVSFHIR